ncbi:IclR family transcriptional regulator [Tepidanaerobacter acetatoxydans]|uniref:IclR family transcriptional regulator n=1 Tax=Tepidanaerobacter acetatoxydans TaxID=499229 RepID=UPI001BD3AC24|nr:IclR family transcriptional regulator [Tepidanaerobacter acetatoxydans]
MSKNTIQSVNRALEILCLIGESNTPLTIQSLSKALKLPRTTLYAPINSLEKYDFIHRDATTKTLSLGWRMYVLGLSFARKHIDPIIEAEARKLKQILKQTIHISIYAKSNKVIFVHTETPDKPYVISPHLGFISHAHCTASGKILLAYQEKNDIDWIYEPEMLQRRTDKTITDPERLLKELDIIRKQGYAVDNEESSLGLTCVAVPIKNLEGKCIASISVSGPKDEIIENIGKIKSELFTVASYINSLGKLDL